MLVAATILLVLFVLVSSVDGIYFHLYKYKLYTRPQSFEEHVTHSIRALLFGPIIYLLFAVNHGGWLLWLCVAAIAVDLGVETWDVLIERKSRQDLGGLSTAEYCVHINATTLRVAAIVLALAAKPADAWKLSSPLVLTEPYPVTQTVIAWIIIVTAVVGALQHFWCMFPPNRRSAS